MSNSASVDAYRRLRFLLLGVIVERVTGGSYYDYVEKYSTVGDLVRFADATMTHKLLNAEYTTLLITGKVDTPRPGSKYAYGFRRARLAASGPSVTAAARRARTAI